MNVEALKQLKRVLQNVPEKEFDITLWDCGTAACAAGWAGRDPWFSSRGLRVTKAPYSMLYYKDLFYEEALMAFFDLTLEQTALFFEWGYEASLEKSNYVTPADVIERIDELLAQEAT